MQQVATEPAGEELSLAERAYRAIRDRLVMLEIRPGAPINEDQLAQSLGVGRTPVREALKRLQYERLITTYPRRGTFATDVNITDLAHISEVRQELEPLAAALAARRATAADRATLTAALRELAGADSPQRDAAELMRLDLQVHRAIYAATHNPYLEDTLVRHDNLATRIWCLFIDRLSDMAGHVGEHGPLIEAVVAGDADKAAQLAHSHVEGFERAIRAAI
ncbi:GntR family transcriptional regulator [Streptomyces sp. DSM 41524]|uniref:GntR family transcriptional regulator n=2 Tax=Streptomyces violaceusniger group TaxID=2839105 RepID=A0A6G4A925_9ACTN|nr:MULTISPECIES: GntR family transcriptional regulator [Streptomyces]EXU61945.1 GntR family transcriptional regulator [Streptomyces sp. PRh5]MEE4596159.1 GntR family transcriptional regulator [Streptomyces sp. DSM 41524]NEW69201.1 GntR family transcriptional regulator [Streptomyces rhizosphaericus]TMU96632.1 GntR family transcriptional regulator [Streptomyces sp. DASNCL29]